MSEQKPMSEQEEFLKRWMRLKQQSSTEAQPDATEPQRDKIGPASPPIPDPASAGGGPVLLPAIESITAESDIRLFLESGVPTELVRAALRAAWTTDPKIRDFVGIAESQWDFNDPSAMPGFGPLVATPDAQTVVRHSAALLDSTLDAIEGKTQVVNPQRDGQVDKVWLSSGEENKNPRRVEVTGQSPKPAAHNEDSLSRHHGGALPK